MSTLISVIKGDGIGPEIMDASLRALDALHPEVIDKNYHDKTQHGALLGKPETQWKAAKAKLVQPVTEDNAAHK